MPLSARLHNTRQGHETVITQDNEYLERGYYSSHLKGSNYSPLGFEMFALYLIPFDESCTP